MAAEKKVRTNEMITHPEVRVIDADGNQVGVIKTSKALEMAAEAELDLVEVSPNAEPPVCRIMDYGKYKFEINKKQQAAKKKQKQVQIKEIKFRPRTEEGDYQTKLRKLREFLEEGDKAKVTLRFRGREIAHQELGLQQLERVGKDLEDIAVIEQVPKMEGRQMVMMLSPKKTK
ncbi:MAG: translation initiation factor IF-3 [Gammaproteobacteria bacterium]|nr:MAG: translation initiation factor IF-3 [Gammaproteobacteria bacterium]